MFHWKNTITLLSYNCGDKMKGKIAKTLKIIIIILAIILVIETAFLIYVKIKNEKNTIYIDSILSLKEVQSGYISVGKSDFKHNDFVDYEKNGYSQAILTKYDKEFKQEFSLKHASGYYSSFNDVIETTDGYVAVGEIQMSERQNKDDIYEGVIVKYDKKGDIKWQKNFQVLDTSKFNKIIEDTDGNYIVVGQSLYLPNMLGNHTSGGAIIVKYDRDGKLLKQANYDGPKTGVYNDVIETTDGYLVVGKIKSNSGIIAKYDKQLNLEWRKLYGNTDSIGFKTILLNNKNIIVGGSKVTTSGKSLGLIIKYDLNGNKIDEVTYEKNEINRIESLLIDNDRIIATTSSMSKKENSKIDANILIYNSNFELIKEKNIENNKTTVLTGIQKKDSNYLIYGYTNSKIEEIKSNGKDIVSLIIKTNSDLELEYLKIK